MGIRVLAGERFNWLSRGTVASSTMDSNFPIAGAYDGRASIPARFSAAGADKTISVDTTLLTNGDFETGTLTGWTEAVTGTGSTGVEAVNIHGGAKAVKVNGGAAGTGMRYQDVTVRAGETLTAGVWLRGDGTRTVYARILNLQTGKYLTSGGAWSASVSAWASRATATYGDTALTFNVEAMSVVLAATCTLRFQIVADGNGDVFADDVSLYAGAIDWLSIHGHNVEPQLAVRFQWSDDNSSWTTAATATVMHPAFYTVLSSGLSHRYWRVLFSGTPSSATWVGEVVIGQSLSLTNAPRYPLSTTWREQQLVNDPRDAMVCSVSAQAARELRLTWGLRSLTAYQQFRDEVYRRCRGGLYPLVVAPDDTVEDVVLGRLDPDVDFERRFLAYREAALRVTEMSLPVVLVA